MNDIATDSATSPVSPSAIASRPVETVVIMPIFGQAAYLGEALASVLAQETEVGYRIVLVDDCCPDENTAREAIKAARARPDLVHYIHSASNRGLSAVRNTGVEYALERWPELFSILFFDGDDRMHRKLVDRSVRALREAIDSNADASSRIGWVFEDPDHFGMDGLIKRVHRYSSLFSMAGCANTSSSMILGDMFRSGLRYSESMLGGGEDWSFWLSALKSGFRGVFAPRLGFQYRRRPGSMAYHALNAADRNRATIRMSHPELYGPDFYLREESRESPRYAVFTPDAVPDSIARGRQITFPDVDTLVKMILDYEHCPTQPIPQYIVFSSATCLLDLDREKLLDWCLWRLEAQAGSENVVTTRFIDRSEERLRLEIGEDRPYSTGAKNGELFCLSIDRLIRISRHHDRLESCVSESWFRGANIGTDAVTGRAVFAEFDQFLGAVRTKYRRLSQRISRHGFGSWKPFGLGRAQLSEHFFAASPLVPIADGDRAVLCIARSEGLVAGTATGDGLRRFAVACRAGGLAPSLLVFGDRLGGEPGAAFDRLFLCRDKVVNGRRLPDLGRDALTGLLLPFSGVVTFGTTEYAADINQLRRYRRSTSHVHVRETPSDGLPDTDLINCFKVYTNVLCTRERDAIGAEALGVSPEQMVGSEAELVARLGGARAEDAAPVF